LVLFQRKLFTIRCYRQLPQHQGDDALVVVEAKDRLMTADDPGLVQGWKNQADRFTSA